MSNNKNDVSIFNFTIGSVASCRSSNGYEVETVN